MFLKYIIIAKINKNQEHDISNSFNRNIIKINYKTMV